MSDSLHAHILLRYAADRDAGRPCDLAAYLALYPGFEDAVRSFWVEIEGLEARTRSRADTSEERPARDAAIRRLGAYRIERELGRGSQGIVYLAVDEHLRRPVALKVLSGNLTTSSDALRRFRREAEVLAGLDHPAICAVYDSGVDEGRPFIAMRYVAGETLAKRLAAGRRPDWPWVVTLVEKLARAVHHAHSVGVVHRDLKPANVVFNAQDEPVILDFGLARVGEPDGTDMTQTGDVLGTPAYMAPEQVSGNGRVDQRCDVYALGVVLYEALAGTRPFERATREDLYRAILEGSASDVRRAAPDIPRDLGIVVMKAIERDLDRRYLSAATLADDLARVAAGEPILARRPGPLRRLMHFRRRHPTLSVSALLALAGACVFMIWQQRALEREREDKNAIAEKEKVALAALRRAEGNRIGLQSLALSKGDPALALLLGIEAAERAPGAAAREVLWRAMGGARETHVLYGHDDVPGHGGFAPDGRTFVSVDERGLAILWSVESGAEIDRFELGRRPVGVAVIGGGVLLADRGGTLTLFQVGKPGATVRREAAHPGVSTLSVSTDGRFAVTSGGDSVKEWSLPAIELAVERRGPFRCAVAGARGAIIVEPGSSAGLVVRDLEARRETPIDIPADLAAEGPPECVGIFGAAAMPSVAAHWSGRSNVLWDAATGELVVRADETPATGALTALAATPDGRFVALGGTTHGVYDAVARRFVVDPLAADPPVRIGYSAPAPGGQRLATWSGGAATVEIWDLPLGRRRFVFNSHTYGLTGVVWSPDGRRLATLSNDATGRLWDMDSPLERRGLLAAGRRHALRCVDVDPTGREALCIRRGDGIERQGPVLVDLETGAARELAADFRKVWAASYGASADRIAVVGDATRLGVYSRASGERLGALREFPESFAIPVTWRGVSPDGKRVVVAQQKSVALVRLDDAAAPPLALDAVSYRWPAWRADGRLLALAEGGSNLVNLVDPESGVSRRKLVGHTGFTISVEFSHDGKRLVSTAVDQSARIWDVATGRTLVLLSGLGMTENVASFSPDDRLVVVWTPKGYFLFESETGEPYGSIVSPDAQFVSGRVVDGGEWFLSIDAAGIARRWPMEPLPWAKAHAPRVLDGREVVSQQIGTREEQRVYSDLWTIEHGRQFQRLALALRHLSESDFTGAFEICRDAIRRRPSYPDGYFGLACVYAQRGGALDRERALAALETAVRSGWEDIERMRNDPFLESLHAEPRFTALVSPDSTPAAESRRD